MSFRLTYVIMNLLWLCMLYYAWMRERFKKNRKENNQEDQISELTFNFSKALSILTFYKNELTLFTEKKKKIKAFICVSIFEKVNSCVTFWKPVFKYSSLSQVPISKFFHVSRKIVGQKTRKGLINNKHNVACLIIMKE